MTCAQPPAVSRALAPHPPVWALQLPVLAPPTTTALSVDLGAVLKTLVQVHGHQLLIDGVYNADPHPGNVIVLKDGRLGLIDYGMVGRLGRAERESIVGTLVPLGHSPPRSLFQLACPWMPGGDDAYSCPMLSIA